MLAILATLISSFSRLATGQRVATRFKHTLDIPFPPVLHRTLDAAYLEQFDEILIIGDVHGCFDEMGKLIRSVSEGQHANSNILNIFVGDLVNKGPKSKEVINYMLQHVDNCLSVRGNHDEVVISEYHKWQSDPNCLTGRNAWIKLLTDNEISYLTSLPYTISIPSHNAIVVHAGLIPGLKLDDTNPANLVTLRNIISNGEVMTGTKKGNEGEPWASKWSGPEHVYFGHDAIRMLQKFEFATGLDTGCVYGLMLTAVFIKGPRKNSFVHVNATKEYQKPTGLKA